ncbi:peptide ABC transporter substrate-binding protein [Furfurilactobacillus sp. WILCCON 0119]
MKLRKIMVLGAVAALSVITLAACGNKNSASSHKGVLNLGVSAEMPGLDTSKVTDNTSLTALANTQEGLYRTEKDSKPVPALATKTTESKDGLHWTFTLRKGTKWSNGDPVTAKDFVYSWQRTNNPKTGSQYAYLFEGVKNATAIQNGKADVKSLGIKAVGDNKLEVTLEKPIPYFKLLLGFPIFFPQDQKVVEKYGSEYGMKATNQVYNGPFKVEDWTGTNTKWKWVKNDDYWDKSAVKTNTINWQVVKESNTALNLYNSGKIDMTGLTGSQVANYKNDKSYKYYQGSTSTYMELNEAKVPAFKNEKIRQALSLAVDRKQMVDNVLQDGSQPATGLIPSKLAKNPKTGADFAKDAEVPVTTDYDMTKAKQLLKEGEKEAGISSLSFTLLADDTSTAKQSSEFLQSQFEKLPGVKVSLQNVPFKNRLAKSSSGDFDAVITLWGADYNDPYTYSSLYMSDNSQNNGKWSNASYDENVKKSADQDAGNKQARYNDLVNAEKTLTQSAGVIPLYWGTASGSGPMLQKSYVKGLIYNSAGVNFDYKYVDVK